MKNLKLIILFAATLFLFGCASGAKKENMVYEPSAPMSFDTKLKNSVDVENTSGGKNTNPAWTSEISNEAFSGAVKESLLRQGLLSDAGKYKLQITLIKVDQPFFGLDLEVTTHVKYTLTDSSNSSVIFDEIIVKPYTATVGDAFAAVKRLRLANEGAGKENIKGLLEKLAELKIQPNQVSVVN